MAIKMLVIVMMLFTATCLGQKEEVDLDFKEDGKRYKEKIIFDEVENTTEYDVPKHGNLVETSYLVDHKTGVHVMKIERTKKCYLMDVSAEEGNIEDTKKALNKIGGKFPEDKYIVENHQLVPTERLNPMDVSPKFRQFCGNFPIFRVEETTLEEMEIRAMQFISRRSKRQSTVFAYCTPPTTYNMNCPYGKTLTSKCQFQAKSCIYTVTCSTSTGQWMCQGKYIHTYNKFICCDFFCN